MKRHAGTLLALALAASFLTGCTAVSLSSMSSAMNDLARQKEELIGMESGSLRSGPRADGTVVTLAQIDSDLMAVSEEAQELAEATGTSTRTAISAWRVAVHAAWLALPVDTESLEAQPVNRALTVAGLGKGECDSADTENSFTNPRDCALIAFAPVQIAFQVLWERYRRLASDTAPGSETFFQGAGQLFREYQAEVWEEAWNKGAQAIGYDGLDDSVERYVEQERFIFMCAALVRFQALNRVDPAQGAESARNAALEDYRSLLQALATRFELSVTDFRNEKTPECTTRLGTLGMGS